MMILKNIIKDYRENYDGDYFMYECVDRDILTAVAEAFDRGELTEVEFKDLSNYVLSDYCIRLMNKSLLSITLM